MFRNSKYRHTRLFRSIIFNFSTPRPETCSTTTSGSPRGYPAPEAEELFLTTMPPAQAAGGEQRSQPSKKPCHLSRMQLTPATINPNFCILLFAHFGTSAARSQVLRMGFFVHRIQGQYWMFDRKKNYCCYKEHNVMFLQWMNEIYYFCSLKTNTPAFRERLFHFSQIHLQIYSF